MHPKYLALMATIAFAMSSIGCQHDATAPTSGDGPSFSAQSTTENIQNLIEVTKFVPCANGGLGEDVTLSGSFHTMSHVTLDGSGGAHVKVVHNPQGISGTGLTTGTKYLGVGGSPTDGFNVKVGEENTSVINMRIIGQGPGNNLQIHSDFHFTVLANGVVTSFHDNVRITCK
ncbi:MAG: hypothetical protein ABJC36_13225 [Gemmatimonadales bacterium]